MTDDTLVQSIGELRRELREDGSRLLKTIPRRGYRFDTSVTGLTAGDDLVPEAVAPEPMPCHDKPTPTKPTPSDIWRSLSSRVTFANRRWPVIGALSFMILIAILIAAGAVLLHRSNQILTLRTRRAYPSG